MSVLIRNYCHIAPVNGEGGILVVTAALMMLAWALSMCAVVVVVVACTERIVRNLLLSLDSTARFAQCSGQ